eukprot:1957976-Amphidinium_carterae.1
MTTCARLAVSCTVYKTPWPPPFARADSLNRTSLSVSRYTSSALTRYERRGGCYLHLLTLHSFGPARPLLLHRTSQPPGFHALRGDRRGGFLMFG